ncbi:MAG: 5'/3'-nucleotidase SurE [Thermodesulfobacteriota bacterium]
MTDEKPIILLTNDDGIHAEGLRYLKEAAAGLGRVRIVAPETEQSAVGHAITLYDPIKVHEVIKDGEFYGYGIHGTPADSVKLALHALLSERPALVISGINNGANLGINVLYSGTVSAATEAAILGVPSMAVSVAQKKYPPFQWVVSHIQTLGRLVLKNRLPEGVALNVNVPAIPPDQVRGYKLTKQGLSRFSDSFEHYTDPRGNRFYWLSGEVVPDVNDTEIDMAAVREGYVSVTPLFYDLTAYACKQDLAWALENL